MKIPKQMVLYINDTLDYDSGIPSSDTYRSAIECDNAMFFKFAKITYFSNHRIKLSLMPTKMDNLGQYTVNLILEDNFEFGPKTTTYKFIVFVKVKKDQSEDFFSNKIGRNQTDEEKQAMNIDKFIPVIEF